MNKSELIERVAAATGKTKKEAGMVVDAVLETISEALKRGEKVSLVGFGNFEVRERSARPVGIPRPGKRFTSKPPASLPSSPASS